MNTPSDVEPASGDGDRSETCVACNSDLDATSHFCPRCGHEIAPAVHDSLVADGRRSPEHATPSMVGGRAHREGVPEWLAVVAGVAVVLTLWLLISRPGEGTEATGEPSSTTRQHVDEQVAADPPEEPQLEQESTEETVPSADPGADDEISPPVPADESSGAATPGTEADRRPPVSIGDLGLVGWRLLVGDGHTIVDVDLGSGGRRRHPGAGTPIAVIDDRLLVYRDSRLSWLSPDELGGPGEEIIEVAALQRMFTRGRSADRPIVVDRRTAGDNGDDDPAVWWPNNNANPQTWIKLRLSDGTVLDSISLTENVFGGPEVVATIGSGSFERVDGRWLPVGSLFASSASTDAIVGQQCDGPNDCVWVLQTRGDAAAEPERLSVPVGGPFDLTLVADADRVLLRRSDGVTDHRTGRFVPMVAANASTVTAVARAEVLALADGAGIGSRSSSVMVVNLDGPADREPAEILLDDLVPRWLVLVPPDR